MSRRYLLDQNKTPLYDAVRKFADWDPVPFFIPSHKMGSGIDPRFKSFVGENIFRIDLSEVRWTDDFHGASSSIKEAQELAADAWGAAQSHFLINGTSGGIIASICAVCGEGDRIIVPRNAHKSAVYGLVVSGAEPVYVMPEIDSGRGIVGGFSPAALEQALEQYSGKRHRSASQLHPSVAECTGIKHTGVKAVFTVSPTYHGVMSDTEALAEIAHRQNAVLISDEAHGSHVYFSERLPKGALELGADIVCQSTHKMSGSLTQSSILHLGFGAKTRVDFDRVSANLSMIQSTSPSYILLASLDLARSYIATQGEALLGGVQDALEKAREEITALSGIEALGNTIEAAAGAFLAGSNGVSDYEPTRLAVSARALGIDGYTLFRLLREQYDIECEFADPYWCVCVAGLGTTRAHTEALTSALAEISCKYGRNCDETPCPLASVLPPIPTLRLTPREAWFAVKETVPFESARGRISAEMVVPYPPGIPVLCPGDEITDDVHGFLAGQKAEGRHLHCAAGDNLETIIAVKQKAWIRSSAPKNPSISPCAPAKIYLGGARER